MTDKKPDSSQPAKTPPQTTPAAPSSKAEATSQKREPEKRRSALVPALVVAVVLAAALGGAVWYQQQAFQQTSTDLLNRVQRNGSSTEQAIQQAQEALQLAQRQSAQISTLEQELRDSHNQVSSLEQAFQLLTDSGSDLVLINDIDHLVTIAQQQLQLGGNVANAIISLETAQAQLARANRPALASLQQTINGDLDRLRAASTIDIALLSTQLEELAMLVSRAALLVPDDAHPETVTRPDADAASTTPEDASATQVNPEDPWWKRSLDQANAWSQSAWHTLGNEFGQLVSIRRVDDGTALLLSPDQATRLRENLRLRIMTAQLALMMRQPGVWQTETASLVKALETRYDPQSQQARKALNMARQMADIDIDVKLPTVDNSLQALEVLREASAKEAQGVEDTSVPQDPDSSADEPPTQELAPAADTVSDQEPASVDTAADQSDGTQE